jgi:gentisate 1,2-dioxygenase
MTQEAIQRLLSATDLDSLYPVLDGNRMTPGWHKKRPSLWKTPRTEFKPCHWKYKVGRLAMEQAGRWMDTEMAERRNLLLYNPVGDNDYDSLRTLVVAYQMLKPGEHARAHWHTPAAMRYIVDADEGCYSVVDGVQVPMRPGDVLLTPAFAMHSHFNEGTGNAYWIDILDVPIVHRLEPMFWGEHPDKYQTTSLKPDEHPFYLPPKKTLPQLDAQAAADGVQRVKFDAGEHIRTFDISFVRVAAGKSTPLSQNTTSRVIVAQSGTGVARIGNQRFEFERGDVMVAPIWSPVCIESNDGCLLMEVTDFPIMNALGFFREAKA